MTIYLWNHGLGGNATALYRHFLRHYDQTDFSGATSWRDFLENYVRSVPARRVELKLKYPYHELYLHVYDKYGRHVGLNRSAADDSLTPVDQGIPNALYVDFMNGTKYILLPGDLEDFTVVVDGNSMEEAEEPYAIGYTLVDDGVVTYARTIEGTIERDTSHRTQVAVGEDGLEIGEIETEDGGKKGELPGWFRETFPFLLPLVNPIVPFLPGALLPLVPLAVLGLPIILIVAGIMIVRRRKGGEQKKV
jgi:hypothetical protein